MTRIVRWDGFGDCRDGAASCHHSCKRLRKVVRERVEDWGRRVRDLEERRGQGIGSFADLLKARLEWLKARGDLVKEVTAWERGFVKLKQDQGLLGILFVDGDSRPCHGNRFTHYTQPGHWKEEDGSSHNTFSPNG